MLGALATSAVILQSGIAFDAIRALVETCVWLLLAVLLRAQIRQPSQLTTLAAGVVLGTAWATQHYLVGLVKTMQLATELSGKSPTPVDVSLDLNGLLHCLCTSVAIAVGGAFVLRALPDHFRKEPQRRLLPPKVTDVAHPWDQFMYVAWFRNRQLPPDDPEAEWPACFVIRAPSVTDAKAWGDQLANGMCSRNHDESFLWSEIQTRGDPLYSDKNWTQVPEIFFGRPASDEEIGW